MCTSVMFFGNFIEEEQTGPNLVNFWLLTQDDTSAVVMRAFLLSHFLIKSPLMENWMFFKGVGKHYSQRMKEGFAVSTQSTAEK